MDIITAMQVMATLQQGLGSGNDRQPATVECDAGCEAPEDPETLDEYKAAYEHWRHHHCGYGCSHGAQ